MNMYTGQLLKDHELANALGPLSSFDYCDTLLGHSKSSTVQCFLVIFNVEIRFSYFPPTCLNRHAITSKYIMHCVCLGY